MRKNNLDEMQEQKLLKIEHTAAWFSFWALLAAIFIQMCMRASFFQVAGELVVLMSLAVYIEIACLKAGIWDRRLKPTMKTNFIISIAAALITGVLLGAANYLNYKNLMVSGFTAASIALLVFVLCFLALQISSNIYKKRARILEEKCEDGSKDN